MEWNNGLLAGLYRSEANEKFPMPKGGRKPHDEFAQSESYINFRARGRDVFSQSLYINMRKRRKIKLGYV